MVHKQFYSHLIFLLPTVPIELHIANTESATIFGPSRGRSHATRKDGPIYNDIRVGLDGSMLIAFQRWARDMFDPGLHALICGV
jgi:hypothetical protein